MLNSYSYTQIRVPTRPKRQWCSVCHQLVVHCWCRSNSNETSSEWSCECVCAFFQAVRARAQGSFGGCTTTNPIVQGVACKTPLALHPRPRCCLVTLATIDPCRRRSCRNTHSHPGQYIAIILLPRPNHLRLISVHASIHA